MLEHVRTAAGFIAALDQSGGSTPKALRLYGIEESEYSSDAEMFDLMHAMRTRIVTSPSFTRRSGARGDPVREHDGSQIEGRGSAEYLWAVKGVVPFLKVDKGLEAEADGAQVMKPMPDLDALCERAVAAGVFGTKMRSVIQHADAAGVERGRRAAVRRRASDHRPRAWCRSSNPRSTSTARPRPRPRCCCVTRSRQSSPRSVRPSW